ncbi:MAG: ParA family protein [Oscillospiraceae bacterium]|jgi:chromosome partitioning protein|nr:ParA family protein [Oscillospiraceae bacterium]MBQ8930009.1 ParA family protein [Oscillospiraceae bacterium]MBR6429973.1 ParA family protein [Oscillospiraceae bacterium]
MGKIIAVANQKGGVGKTTTCTNLCCALKNEGKSVLLCDVDPQGNATSGMGVDKNGVKPTVYDVFVGAAKVSDAVIATKYGDVLPANKDLSGAAIELVGMESREFILRDALESLRDRYDYIVVDCPPSLEMLTLNALCAADSVLIPVQCEYFALEGLADLITTIRGIKRRLNPRLEIEGVLLTMYDGRTNFSAQVAAEVKTYFRTKVYSVLIPRNVRLSEAPSHGKPAVVYDRSSRGAVAYTQLARELIRANR